MSAPCWQGRERYVMLDTDFDTGQHFLATWQTWRDDPQRCTRLVYIALAPQGVTRARLLHPDGTPALRGLAEAVTRVWPTATPDLHRLSLDDGQVELWLAPGDASSWLRELVVDVDAFCIGAGLPADSLRLCKALGRLAAPGATMDAAFADDVFRADLRSAGFEVRDAAAHGHTHARFAPTFTAKPAPRRAPHLDASDRQTLIIGAGLAGCAAAWALAEQGWRSTLLERSDQIASAASGNPAGLFHGIVNAQDGVHARFNRAAALAAHEAVQAAIESGVAGNADGLLRLETMLDVPAMQVVLAQLGLPPEYVQALSPELASARAGIALGRPCWFYPGGGWVRPGGLARSLLDRAGALANVCTGVDAHHLERCATGWRALDAAGELIAEAATVVLANAGDALRLLGAPDWPLQNVRGQISIARASRLASTNLPIAGSGYLLPACEGTVMFGATAQPADLDPSVRDADHGLNLTQLSRLLGHSSDLQPEELEGRTAWRCSAADRLPVIGAVPDPKARGARLDQPRFVPRLPGLFVFNALGSRGITWSALGAQVLASWVTGSPAPIGASLLDAVDPARFVSRQVRRAAPPPHSKARDD